jgi:glycosyltransferase involved in cell wall biosynthesis
MALRPHNFNTMPTKRQLPISVCMIAGNEAQRIRHALESVAGWTSEVIVLLNDDVSDGTDKIAGSFGAKVIREPWKGHIAQKNSAAQKAACDWILGLDADEAISPELSDEIQKLFSEPEKLQPFAAFRFPRLTFFCGRWIRHGDWYPDHQTRLWRCACVVGLENCAMTFCITTPRALTSKSKKFRATAKIFFATP